MDELNTPKKPLLIFWAIALIVLFALNLVLVPLAQKQQISDVPYSTFIDDTEKGKIEEVEIETNKIIYTRKDDDKMVYETGIVQDAGLIDRLMANGVTFSSEIVEQTSPVLSFILYWILPIIIFFVLAHIIQKQAMKNMTGDDSMSFGGGFGMGMGNFGKSNARVYVKSSGGIKFSDVAGEEEAKENLQEIVTYLKDPTKYREIGAKMPKGVLLVGPPGTGKTMLAKAVAGEADVPFFSMSGSEFVEMFVGMGASKVRDLFRQAKEEREQTLNQLLTEMDGFDENTGVIILAATNRPESLDPALTRPGRFDRRVPVELPDLKGREDILKVHAKNVRIADNVDFNKIARMAAGASGAELANIINEAALRAVRMHRRFVTQEDLEESIEVVIAGYQKKNAILTDKEKMIVSYHEVGHALVAALQTGTAPVQKITIIPRTSGALGYTMQVDEGNHYLYSKDELMKEIATLCGGRSAEEIEFGLVSTGASNDIEKATKLARQMITQYGMSDDFGMVALETVQNQYLGGDASLACSPETQTKIDQEVVDLVEKQHDKAKKLLQDNKSKLDEIAKYLYERETITGEEFMDILTRKPQLTGASAAPSAD